MKYSTFLKYTNIPLHFPIPRITVPFNLRVFQSRIILFPGLSFCRFHRFFLSSLPLALISRVFSSQWLYSFACLYCDQFSWLGAFHSYRSLHPLVMPRTPVFSIFVRQSIAPANQFELVCLSVYAAIYFTRFSR